MAEISVERYRPEFREEWDAFVRTSRNGTFILERGYMDYHADRFEDFSLIVRTPNGHPAALLPANRDGECLVSHAGLTYGGFVVGSAMRTGRMLETVAHTGRFLMESGIRDWVHKPVPYIYHREPADDELYSLFRYGATLIRRDVGACGCPANLRFSDGARRWARKAEKAGLVVEESGQFGEFWPALEGSLESRHRRHPVHTLDEITSLRGRFPDKIRLFLARRAGLVTAGLVIYETDKVAHVQYAAATEEGLRTGAQALLVARAISDCFRDKPWFDYGISTESEGLVLNEGLQHFKEGFGLRAVVSDLYRVPLWEGRMP